MNDEGGQEKFGRLLDAAPDAMVIVDTGGRIVFVNASAVHLFGFDRRELVGQSVEAIVPARFRERHAAHRETYNTAPRTRPMGTPGLRLFARRKDGSEFPADISLSHVELDGRGLTIAAIRDTTERLKAEEARAHVLRMQEALRMRDEFMQVASHELRTPLAAVALQTDAVLRLARKDGEAVPPRVVSRLEIIHGAVERLNGLIHQLLDSSRISSGELVLRREDVDLAATARNVAGLLEGELTRSGSQLTVTAEAPVVGRWDPVRIEQIVSNLLFNAIKYGDGNPIELTVSGSQPDEARLVVRDHGIGIAPEHQSRIFERFERVASVRNYPGVGLGLWLVRELARAHGGSVVVWSAPGVGSEFTLTLPRRRPAPISTAPGEPEVARTVMLVEDDAMVRESFADVLEVEGYHVVAAENGQVALEILRGGLRPKLIFLDLMMPVMDGWAFRAEQTKSEELAAIPVVVLSAMDDVAGGAERLGAVACLSKPPDIAAVIRLLERYGA